MKGSYLVPGPPDLDIRDISFKLRHIPSINHFQELNDGFGQNKVEHFPTVP